MSDIIKKAREEISRLCNRGNWQMCIPPDQANDSDFIFSKVCDLAEERYKEMVRLQNCNLDHGRKIQTLESQLTEKEALLKEVLYLFCDIHGLHMRMNEGRLYSGPLGEIFEVGKKILDREDVKRVLGL